MLDFIPFDEIMKEPDNWDDNIDIEAMNENHEILKPIFSKFYFRSMPNNPKVFSLVFSNLEFGRTLLNGIKAARIKELEAVIFCEYTREDKEKLISLGVLSHNPIDRITVLYTANKNVFFVNVLL